jgi:hypothetical protein
VLLHGFFLKFLPVCGAFVSGTALRVSKKPGESCLKPAKNKTKHTSNLSTHTQRGPRCGGPRGPPEWPNQAPPRARSASLEGSHPLERVPPCSRAHAPSSGFRLARGLMPPRAGSARSRVPSSLERVPPRSRVPSSLERAPPRSRLPHERTCSHMRVRAFNALTQQSRAITRLGITPRRCSANSLGETHPRHSGDCATRPVSAP